MVCFAIGFVHGTDRSLPSLSLSRHPFFPTRNIEPRLRSWQPARDRCYFSSIRSSRSPSQNIARESPSAFKCCPAPIFGPPRLQRRRSERKYEGKKREERTRRGGSRGEIVVEIARDSDAVRSATKPAIPATPLGPGDR